VDPNGPGRHQQSRRDLFVGESLREPPQHVALSRRQRHSLFHRPRPLREMSQQRAHQMFRDDGLAHLHRVHRPAKILGLHGCRQVSGHAHAHGVETGLLARPRRDREHANPGHDASRDRERFEILSHELDPVNDDDVGLNMSQLRSALA
jgi:hypothetical protein